MLVERKEIITVKLICITVEQAVCRVPGGADEVSVHLTRPIGNGK